MSILAGIILAFIAFAILGFFNQAGSINKHYDKADFYKKDSVEVDEEHKENREMFFPS